MKKFASALALVLVFSLVLPIQAFAAVTGQEAVNTLRALEIMTGDERGDLHLDRQLTRAQLAKMLCASSAYKNSVNEKGLGYSVFSDVAPTHWAGQY
ncbi:MAG: S-layer homology domain-containing protein, partial [Firmicutes bacterium]|nr:S-layer homology domain-containing protein [Bacillota bacterium]